MDLFPASPATHTGATPVDVAMRAAREKAAAFFTQDLGPGCVGEVLDQATRIRQELDQLNLTMATCLARIEAGGELLNEGGHKDLPTWLRHSFAISGTEAGDLAAVGRAAVHQTMPRTLEKLSDGVLSFGESAAIIKSAERETDKRDTTDPENADANRYRAKVECGLLEFKELFPQASVAGLTAAGSRIGARLNPNRPERDHEAAHAARGARLSRTFGGSFLFQAWGSAADALRLEALLEGYANPYDVEDGLSSSERSYDAFMNATGFAQSHQGCEKPGSPVALINILIPAETLAGEEGQEAATTANGRVVPTSVVREYFSEALIRRLMVERTSGAVLDVGHEYRTATPEIKIAAFLGHTTCAWQHGCDVPLKWAQADHIVEWWQGGRTSVENIQPLCQRHNRLKHRWGLRKDRKMWSGRQRGRGHPPPDGGEGSPSHPSTS